MKNLRTIIDNWYDKLDGLWRAMPVKRQYRYTLLLFAGYALLSVIVVGKVCYDVGKSDNGITVGHIENPVVRQNKSSVPPQDSISTILKKRIYEK